MDLWVLNFKLSVAKPTLCLPAAGANEATLEGFPEGPLKMMNCMICALNERLSIGNYISFRIMRSGSFWMIVNGLILLVTFMIIKLSFVFYLVDNVFKFAVIVVMLPILVLFYPFQKKWAIFGVKTILSSAAFMMGISIMIAISMKALFEIIAQHPEIFSPGTAAAGQALKMRAKRPKKPWTFQRRLSGNLAAGIYDCFNHKVAKEITSAMVDVKLMTASSKNCSASA